MTLKGGASQACAACKYQRRKCTPGCLLAPYFPADKPHMFRNVHKLFGVCNILKILKNLDPALRPEAMNSIICQAKYRDMFPVQGCCQVIGIYVTQIRQTEEELNAVLAQLQMCRQQLPQVSNVMDTVPSQLELGMALPLNDNNNNDPDTLEPYSGVLAGLPNATMQQLPSYSSDSSCNVSSYTNTSSPYIDIKDNSVGNQLWIQNQYMSSDNNCSVAEPQLLNSSLPLAIQQDIAHGFEELHPFFDGVDERQSYIDSKEQSDSSTESSVKETTHSMEHVSENELRSAAACFSLTSVN